MAFAYIPMSPDDKKLLETIFTDEFMQAETNFEAFRDFQSSGSSTGSTSCSPSSTLST